MTAKFDKKVSSKVSKSYDRMLDSLENVRTLLASGRLEVPDELHQVGLELLDDEINRTLLVTARMKGLIEI